MSTTRTCPRRLNCCSTRHLGAIRKSNSRHRRISYQRHTILPINLKTLNVPRYTTNWRRKASTLFKQVKRTVGRYAVRGFRVTQIFGDNAFNCIEDRIVEELDTTFSAVGRGAHEPYIKRDNRVSKERCNCVYSGLPFNRMSPRMIMELPVAVDFWLNYWCSSGGVSKTIPPRQIVTGIALDASKHCKIQYGDYVVATNETDNTMKERATDSIYLRPTWTANGSFFVFDLRTARCVRKHSATLAHMTDSVIKRVHAIADSQ